MDDYYRLRTITYPQTDLFLVAFSVDCTDSLENVREHWIHEIRYHCPNTPWLLLGLKADLRNSSDAAADVVRRGGKFVTPEAARDMARELGMSVQQSMQCSLFRTLTHQSPSMHTTSVFVNSVFIYRSSWVL